MTLLQDSQSSELELGAILEPEPISFSFNTIGWKILLVLLIFLIIYVGYRIFVTYRNNKYKRSAVAEIEALVKNNEQPLNSFITRVLIVLKQTALQSYTRVEVASLQGDEWLSFLDEKVPGSNFIAYKSAITDAIYSKTLLTKAYFNKEEFSQLTIKWIKKHA
ncbi:MAG: DUF4381 domain-containing protein [Flavobacteriaceae bacterium]|nr:DUF4381 domain-containing protein [Flavobacteriaceae bacterium]